MAAASVLFLLFLVLWGAEQGDSFLLPPSSRRFQRMRSFSGNNIRFQSVAVSDAAVNIGDYDLFRGHKVYSEVYEGTKKNDKNVNVILIHGFGCSTVYWRETIRFLTEEGCRVHALDLLGQGKSDKPGRADGIEYSISLWAEQVDQYSQANIPPSSKIVLVGNSLGSVVALAAATGDFAADTKEDCYLMGKTKGIGMYNCGIGMNSQNVEYDFEGISRVLVVVLFRVLNVLIFGNVPLLTYVLKNIVTQELLRNALTGLYQYSTQDRVDDALVDSFYYPAKDPGSPETLSQIYTNDPGCTPMEMYQNNKEFLFENKIPIHLVWGRHDGVTPLTGSVGQFFSSLAQQEDHLVSLDVMEGGHIPFDEVPSCNQYMVDWLKNDILDAPRKTNEFRFPFFGQQ